jgi:hypothetical protein
VRRSAGEIKSFLDALLASEPGDECVLVPVTAKKYAKLSYEGGRITAHRYICMKAHGDPVGARRFAAHSCGQSWCVNPKHLRWATPKENNDDKIAHGTLVFGEDNYNAKLKMRDVIRIREMKDADPRKIATVFGVSPRTIRDVLEGKTWKQV